MKDYDFINKALWFKTSKILVITDIHIGFEQDLSDSGFFLPRRQYKIIKNDLKRIFETTGKLKEIIILGDLKHQFGGISGQEWSETLDFLDFLSENSKRIVLVKGNHDTILEPISNKKGLEVVDFYVSGENIFIHGHQLHQECLDKKIKRIIVGHNHPAIVIKDKYKKENYKCFLVGKWKRKEFIVLPSFFPLTEGSDIFVENTNLGIPIKLSSFKVYVPILEENKILGIGKVKDVGVLRI